MKRVSLFLFILVFLCSCGEKHYNEWVEKDGNKYYYDEKGNMLKNCYSKIGSDTYVFNEEGTMIKDKIVNLDGKPSFVDSDGKLRYHGWCSSNGNWYYIDKSVLQTGWIKDQGNWYYLDPNYYYMLRNKWVQNKYYVDNEGHMLINTQKDIDGEQYIFDETGIGKRVPDYQLVFNCTFPKSFRDRNYSWSDVIIENISYEIKESYGELGFETYWTGTAGQTKGGPNISEERRVGYKLYDPENYVIDSGTFYTDVSLKTGKKFKDKKKAIGYGKINSKGIYRLELMDVK